MTLRYSLPANWPFRVDSLSFFYGWMIWLVSTLGIICSIPGQTMGLAVFTEYFIDAFALSRTQLSTAYLLGTLASAALLTRAGRFYDRAGARITMVAASTLLGICLVYIALIDRFTAFFISLVPVPIAWISFPLILLGYFGVRFSGQGVLTSASRNVLLLWFDRRRGLVSGARAVFVNLGFSLAPPAIAFLIVFFGWRIALLVLALCVGLGFSLLALLLIRNSPGDCGLAADGEKPGDAPEKTTTVADASAAEARRSPVFWIYAAALALYSLFGTAMVFHIVSIFEFAGRDASQAYHYFFPSAVVSVCTNLLGSWLSDYWPLKRLLLIKLGSFILGAWGLLHLQHDWGYYLFIAGFGTTSGCWGVLSNLAFIRFFGSLHLGEISGLSSTLTVVGSAIGPVMFSVGNDLGGGYQSAIWLNLFVVALLLLVSIVVPQVEPVSRR